MKKTLLPFSIILILAGLLTFWIQDYVGELLGPLFYLFWIGRQLIETIPQLGLWAVFIFFALIIAAGSLLKRPPAQLKIYRTDSARQQRLEGWAKLIRQARDETYYQWQLAQRLQELILDALAHDERLTRKQIRQRLINKKVDLPPEIEAYLQASMTSFSHFVGPEQRFIKSKPQVSPLDLEPEHLIQFLEESFRDRHFTNEQ